MARQQNSEPRSVREWIQDALDVPMVFLALIFLALTVVDLAVPLSPGGHRLATLILWIIWTIFTAEFIVLLVLAPDKSHYLKERWLATLSVFLPFLRIFLALQAIQVLRTLQVFRLYALAHRALKQFTCYWQVRGAAYLLLTTTLVMLIGSVSIYLLERGAPGSTIRGFGDAVWWAAASLSTVGSNLAPVTAEGRILAVLIYFYSMVVIGYLTAILASYFVGKTMLPTAPPSATDEEIANTVNKPAESSQSLQADVDRLIGLLESRAAEKRGQGK
ncbi:MAG TPA: ion transporter [Armatimonadota bacterium]|nr:ion transporter [Armatimonadota bacterium]